jgi:rRNA small subunit pseudouridine methyltransferase Nep1
MDPDADRAPRLPKTQHEKETQRRLIVVLEEACLETVKRGQKFELMNCDDHLHVLRKNKRPLEDVRDMLGQRCCL